jgi:ketosteroid isomerase-like protein
MNSDHVSLVKLVYESLARGDVPGMLALFDPQIDWREAEGFAYADGNPYIGPDAVLKGVFGRLMTEWDGFAATPREFLATPDGVVALGRYTATNKMTRLPLDAPFAHVWRVRDGKLRGFQQFTDTAQFANVSRS